MGGVLELSDTLSDTAPVRTLDETIARALQQNPQLKILLKHATTLTIREAAVNAERLPVLTASGDAAVNVVTPDPSSSSFASRSFTYNAALELRIPILDGHRRDLEHAALRSQVLELQAQERGLRRQIELNVRLAFLALESASEQLALATRSLAEEDANLQEVQAEHAAGTASGLAVQQAQTERAMAQDVRISAVYAAESARLALAEVTGDVESLDW